MGSKIKYEYRSANDVTADTSEDGKKLIIRGKAISFGEPAPVPNRQLGTVREIISPDALDHADLSDVLLKLQHEQKGVTLARVRNGSLKLEKRSDGLYFEAELPDTQAGHDTYESVKTGLMDDMSFGFVSDKNRVDRATRTRYVDGIKYLRELSIVDTGAYDSAYVEARSKAAEEEIAEIEAAAAERDRKIKLLRLKTYFI